MTAAQSAEAQARLNVSLQDLVTFFEEAGANEKSIELMNSFIEKHLTMDFLTLAEGYGKCMAFIDHDKLVSELLKCYLQLIDGYVIERKMINKKLKLLKEDKKADPDVVTRLENLLLDIDNKKAQAMVVSMKLRAMDSIPLSKFMDEKFDPKAYARAQAEHLKELLKVPGKR